MNDLKIETCYGYYAPPVILSNFMSGSLSDIYDPGTYSSSGITDKPQGPVRLEMVKLL
jgi:hypothetical protein